MTAQTSHTLGTLLEGLAEVPEAWAHLPVRGLSADSRGLRVGDIFLAEQGTARHGLDFLPMVRAARAAAVLWEPPYSGPVALTEVHDMPLVAVPHLRRVLGLIASRYYGQPSEQLNVIGITGTDGKTSCAHFIAQALSAPARGPCGLMGTLGFGVYGETLAFTQHTTPDALVIQRWLADLRTRHAHSPFVKGGAEGDLSFSPFAVMEVSSHALDQARVAGVRFTVAVLTNLTHDHLDYHGTQAAYAKAKQRLFTEYAPEWAVFNWNDPFGREFATFRGNLPFIGYGLGARPVSLKHWVWGRDLTLSTSGMHLHVDSSFGEGSLHLRLLGRFNASNALAALSTLLALGIPFDEALARLARTSPVPGRMEQLGGGDQPLVVIDFAHTPHALEQALRTLREQGGRKLWCVFGCGGDRDASKRPLMGMVAHRFADRVIVTDDNPRTESPVQIVQDVVSGIDLAGQFTVTVEHDRRTAILQALTEAQPGDIVLVAGKGHESTQIIGRDRLPFSDRDVISELLKSLSSPHKSHS